MKRMSPRNDNNMPCYLTQDVIDGGQDTRILKGNKDSYILDYSFANKKHTQTYMNHAFTWCFDIETCHFVNNFP